MTLAVLVIWLVGAAVTKYSLEQMAYFAPVAVVVVGATIGLVLLWVKIVRESMRRAARDARGRRLRGALREARSALRAQSSSRPGRTYRGCMVGELAWIEPVSFPEVAARSWRELGVSETVATVLVRRGLGDPDAARAFLEPEGIPHDPLLLGDMAAAVARIRARPSSGESGSACTATTTSTASARPRSRPDAARARRRRRLAPAEPVRGGLRRLHDDDRAARGGRRRASPHGRLRHHRRRGGRGGPPARRRRDRHRPSSARRDAARLPDRRDAALRLPVCRALRHRRRRTSSRRRSSASTTRRSRAMPTSSRSPRSPTSSRSSTRTVRSRRPGLRGLARTQKPGLQALMRVAGVDPATVDATAVGFRLAPRINAAGRLGRPDVALHLVLTDDAARGRSARRTSSETLNRDRQAVEERILREAVAVVDGVACRAAQPPRLRRLGRGLARGRDRDRRLAARRALRPSRRADRRRGGALEGLGPVDRRASICMRASLRAPITSSDSAATVPPPACRSSPSELEAFADAFAALRRRRARRRATSRPVTRDRRDRARPRR